MNRKRSTCSSSFRLTERGSQVVAEMNDSIQDWAAARDFIWHAHKDTDETVIIRGSAY